MKDTCLSLFGDGNKEDVVLEGGLSIGVAPTKGFFDEGTAVVHQEEEPEDVWVREKLTNGREYEVHRFTRETRWIELC